MRALLPSILVLAISACAPAVPHDKQYSDIATATALPTSWTALPTDSATSTPGQPSSDQADGKPRSTPLPPWIPCESSPPSRLRVGDTAFVSYEPDLANRLRTIPDVLEGEVVARLDPGTRVSIADGPTCSNGMVWWSVQVAGLTRRGWTSEGDDAAYWLVPLSPRPRPPFLLADNFDLGLSQDWIYLSGDPYVAYDRLTADEQSWLVVGDPSWSDYTVDFWGDAGQCEHTEGENAVMVRVVDSENLIAFLWTECDSVWLERHGSEWFEVPNSRSKGVGLGMAHITVRVEGTRFTAYLGDEELSSISSELFPSGVVGLMLGPRTQVDDFTVR